MNSDVEVVGLTYEQSAALACALQGMARTDSHELNHVMVLGICVTAADSRQMKGVYKITFPNGKIYVVWTSPTTRSTMRVNACEGTLPSVLR